MYTVICTGSEYQMKYNHRNLNINECMHIIILITLKMYMYIYDTEKNTLIDELSLRGEW